MATIQVEFVDFQKNYATYMGQCLQTGNLIELVSPMSDLNLYVISTHPGCCEVLKNEEGSFVHFAEYFADLENKSEVDQKIGELFAKNLGNNSELHRELRKDIRNHFNGNRVDQHNDFFQECVSELAESLQVIADQNNGVVDLIKDFTKPLTFIVTSHVIGLEFKDEEEKLKSRALAAEAIALINLMAPEEEKIKSLKAHDEFSEFIVPQLEKFSQEVDQGLRKDCLLYDFGQKLRSGNNDRLDNFISLVNGLFQAGLAATGNSLALCLNLMLQGDGDNSSEDIRAYFMAPERTTEAKNEAVSEYIRVASLNLTSVFPRYCPDGGEAMGETIKPNSLVYLSLRRANADTSAFKDPKLVNPERIKIPAGLSKEQLRERRNKRIEKSLNFSYGEHMCPGRRIALVVIRYALDELLHRFPNMHVEGMDVVGEMFGMPSEVTSFSLRLNS